MGTKDQTVNEAYTAQRNQIEAHLQQLNERLEEHAQDPDRNWGHVGDLGYIKELLNQIVQTMTPEPED